MPCSADELAHHRPNECKDVAGRVLDPTFTLPPDPPMPRCDVAIFTAMARDKRKRHGILRGRRSVERMQLPGRTSCAFLETDDDAFGRHIRCQASASFDVVGLQRNCQALVYRGATELR